MGLNPITWDLRRDQMHDIRDQLGIILNAHGVIKTAVKGDDKVVLDMIPKAAKNILSILDAIVTGNQ